MSVVIVGMDKVKATLAQWSGPELDARMGTGLMAWGQVVQTQARQNLHSHHFHGTAEMATTVSSPVSSGTSTSVTVGIHGGLAPEGRPLEFGWASSSGKQPPSGPIYEWLTGSSQGAAALSSIATVKTKGGFISGSKSNRLAASDESAARGLAFVIARSIGKRGYSFGALNWLSKAAVSTITAGKDAFMRVLTK
jgi:hypothetical protein